MEERRNDGDEQKYPIGWPEHIPLPTIEVVAEAVIEGEKMIIEKLNDLRGKIEGPNSEMLRTCITI
jgi:hypothetical protein